MKERIDEIRKQLTAKGFKLTAQREATVKVLLENEDNHLTTEEIYMIVKKDIPEIGIATVYRTLELLKDLHVVEKVNFGDGIARFDLRRQNQAHFHHHLICTECGAVQEILEDWLLPLEVRVEREFGFTVSDHRLDFQGVCHSCKTNQVNATCKAVS
ncbi:Fur family transcriptional regulator [Paenibacillus crassostreae]|uniref:Fur family transcriptional regulator n=1 Tax=Paenibacillus crassostreae TaxID=1763538 RepID=A0A167G538_9BACL|nr:Fur family transcriptional regulator [Paenibacillus crassostreae]AOZ94803.1 transcriptional repressor [Paenibacillus crassostreae]OAB77219.1 Fur family transcriptional regulator [Paenibacillus crassostreae]